MYTSGSYTSFLARMWPAKALDFHVADYNRNGWGKVYLSSNPHTGDNQKWTISHWHNAIENHHEGKGLRLDLRDGNTNNGAAVGCDEPNNSPDQEWEIVT